MRALLLQIYRLSPTAVWRLCQRLAGRPFILTMATTLLPRGSANSCRRFRESDRRFHGDAERAWLDQKCHPLPFGDPGRHQTAQRQRDRFPRRTNHFAKKAVMTGLELEATIGSSEAPIGAEMRQRGDQTLIDVERCELVQLLEKERSLRHYLRQQRNDVRGALPHQSAELSATEKHCLRFFRGACVGDVMTVGRNPSLPKVCPAVAITGNEAAADLDLVAKDYVAIENDEDAVRCDATLIELESSGPGCPRAIRANGCHFIRSETRASHSLLAQFSFGSRHFCSRRDRNVRA